MLSRLSSKVATFDNQRMIVLALSGIVVLAILACLFRVWNTVATFNYQPTTSPTAAKASIPKRSDYNASQITTSQLFGQFEGQLSNNTNIPTTQLQLTLRGAFTSNTPRLASAIIEGPDGQTRSYKINSKVYGNAQLKDVFDNRVVLSRNGQLETLYFPTIDATTSSKNGALNTTASNASGYDIPDDIRNLVQETMSTQEIQQAAKELSSSAMTPEQRKALIRKRLQDLRDRARSKK